MLGQDIGGYIHTIQGIPPAASVAGTVNGAGIDRMASGSEQGFDSCEVHVATGAETGGASARSLTVVITESSDNSSFTTIPNSEGVVPVISAVNTQARLKINLKGRKRYIRAEATTAFTGGSTPTLAGAVTIALGGARVAPADALT